MVLLHMQPRAKGGSTQALLSAGPDEGPKGKGVSGLKTL